MTRTHEKVRDAPGSKRPEYTPLSAAKGIEQALKYIDGRWKLGEHIATQGKEGCRDPRCRRNGATGECMGWHCPKCGEPCSMMGHKCEEQAK